jgi:hypothetical protein
MESVCEIEFDFCCSAGAAAGGLALCALVVIAVFLIRYVLEVNDK